MDGEYCFLPGKEFVIDREVLMTTRARTPCENTIYPTPGNERAIYAAWEAFLAGTPPHLGGALRSVVHTSWQRSRAACVDPRGPRGPVPASDETLQRLRENQRELLEASAFAMAYARDFLAGTGIVMILTDRRSTILDFEGDTRTKRRAEDISLIPGVNWTECCCGTNAIGTALATGQPVQIHSTEHFAEGIKKWTCSATVVRHPMDGEILGVLDVSGLSESYSRRNLALVVTTAAQIESRLQIADIEQRYHLLDQAMTHWIDADQAGTLLFDRRGVLVKVNRNARLALADVGGDPHWLDEKRLSVLDVRRLSALAAGTSPQPGLPVWLRPEWLHPITRGGKRLGTLLIIPSSRRVARMVSLPRDPAPLTAGIMNTLVFRHDSMQQVVNRTRQLAGVQTPVLLQGETGTGKEAFARGLHGTRKGAYMALNCGSLSRDLLASELFGYVEGAFTGARKGGMTGKIEAAHGGTLFLDEIGELPLDMQPLLLRVLEQGEAGRPAEALAYDVAASLLAYDWPGNVRELRNAMEAAVLISEGLPIALSMLPPELQRAVALKAAPVDPAKAVSVSLDEAQAMAIRQAIAAADGNLTRAARQLGIAKSTLYAKMRAYGLSRTP